MKNRHFYILILLIHYPNFCCRVDFARNAE